MKGVCSARSSISKEPMTSATQVGLLFVSSCHELQEKLRWVGIVSRATVHHFIVCYECMTSRVGLSHWELSPLSRYSMGLLALLLKSEARLELRGQEHEIANVMSKDVRANPKRILNREKAAGPKEKMLHFAATWLHGYIFIV
jgi:hypothetical protein